MEKEKEQQEQDNKTEDEILSTFGLPEFIRNQKAQ